MWTDPTFTSDPILGIIIFLILYANQQKQTALQKQWLDSQKNLSSNFRVNNQENSFNNCRDSLGQSNPFLSHSHDKKLPWKIIAFTDLNYLPVTKIWYRQLSALGYNNHYLIPLDNQTDTYLSNLKYPSNVSKKSLRNQKIYRTLPAIDYIDQNDDKKVHKIWKIRLDTVYSLLKSGNHVFTSDVDSIWTNYRNLDHLPYLFEAFHSYGNDFPKNAYNAWNFVLCGCIAGYHRNEKSLKYCKSFFT